MPPLEPPDTILLSACEGWLELGNDEEAALEWDRLSPSARRHPAALELRWHLLARTANWEEAMAVGDQLVAIAPEICAGWLHRAYAVRRAASGGLPQAYETLLPAASLFPEDETVAYNLACYTVQLGRPDDGWEWFLRAIQISKNAARVKSMGLADPDLEPLRDRIRGMR